MRGLFTAVPLCLMLTATTSFGADFIFSPSAGVSYGYDSNRFNEKDGDGSSFTDGMAALNFKVMNESWDLILDGSYRSRCYADEEMDGTGEAFASGQVIIPFQKGSAGVGISGGSFRDWADEESSRDYAGLMGAVDFFHDGGASTGINGYVGYEKYPDKLTFDGDEETGLVYSIGLNGTLKKSRETLFSGHVEFAGTDSNEDADTWTGGGGGLGVTWEPTGVFSLTLEGAVLAKYFPDDETMRRGKRRDTQWSAVLTSSYRVVSWLDLTLESSYVNNDSNRSEEEFTNWTTLFGVKLTY